MTKFCFISQRSEFKGLLLSEVVSHRSTLSDSLWCQTTDAVPERLSFREPGVEVTCCHLSAGRRPRPPQSHAETSEAPPLRPANAAEPLLLQLCVQDEVTHYFAQLLIDQSVDRWADRLICPFRYVNRLKEDDEACTAALKDGSIFLFHRLSPLLRCTDVGTFSPATLTCSGTEPRPSEQR